MNILPILSALVSAVFAVMVLRQYALRRRPYQLAWGVALVFFVIGSLSELAAATNGWTPLNAKAYYLFGGMLLVGYLALGTTYLTFSPTVAKVALVIMLALTAIGSFIMITAEIDTGIINSAIAAGNHWEWKQVVPAPARVIAILLNSVGSLVIIGGALYSGIMVWRKRHDSQRLIANVVIALGALIVAGGGTLGGILGLGQQYISAGQTPGITVMFIGFLLASRTPRPRPEQS